MPPMSKAITPLASTRPITSGLIRQTTISTRDNSATRPRPTRASESNQTSVSVLPRAEHSDQMSPHGAWLSGSVKAIRTDSQWPYGFITPLHPLPQDFSSGDVYFKVDWADYEVQVGDQVFFILKPNKKEKPAAANVCQSIDGAPNVRRQPGDRQRRNSSESSNRRRRSGSRVAARLQDLAPVEFNEGNGPEIAVDTREIGWKSSDENEGDSDRSENRGEDDVRRKRNRWNCEPSSQMRGRGRGGGRGANRWGVLSGKITKVAGLSGLIEIPSKEVNQDKGSRHFEFNNDDSVFSGGLALEVGDHVTFTRHFRKKPLDELPLAQSLQLVKCSRTERQIEEYLDCLLSKLSRKQDSANREKIILAVKCLPVWDCIGNNCRISDKSIITLNSVLVNMQENFAIAENLSLVLETLLKTPLFTERNSRYSRFIDASLRESSAKRSREDLYKVMLMMTKLVPSKLKLIVRTIEPFAFHEFTSFLYKMLKQSAQSVSGDAEDCSWEELPLVPTVKELLAGSLVSGSGLRPVVVKGPYPSVEEYIDIYFRLLRSDCFAALSKGATDLLKGTLDQRDMNVYTQVKMVGFQKAVHGSGLPLGLALKPLRPVANWDQTSCLMYGNLLCISVSGTFRDPIWATVSNRELLSSQSVVIVELCSESNDMTDSDAILSLYLCDSRTVVIESPTYYKAYQPVLKSLQSTDAKELPFQEELVFGRSGSSPEFLQEDVRFDASIVYPLTALAVMDTETIDLHTFLNYRAMYGSSLKSLLDPSQEIAVKMCLKNRIAIVQGPPGTGKTFLGIKLMRILRSLSNPIKTPILVLTYKNHSLDEFMKELVAIYPNEVARVGGRSQDEALASCNLRELRKNLKMPQESYKVVQEIRNRIAESLQDIEDTFQQLNAETYFHPDTLIELLSERQMRRFLVGCPWAKCGAVKLTDRSDEDGFQMAAGKVSAKVVLAKLKKCGELSLGRILKGKENQLIDKALKHDIYELLKAAVRQWVPSDSVFSSLSASFKSNIAVPDFPDSKESDKFSNPEVEGGEKDAEEIEKERIAAAKHKVLPKDLLMKEFTTFEEIKPSGNKKLIRLTESAKEISKQMSPAALLAIDNLWQMDGVDRAKLIHCLLYQQYQEAGKNFENLLQEFQRLKREKEELENHHRVTILRGKKIIGMTITGANINHSFVAELKPEIVIVEEAAEVLEPQIVALLGNWTKQLILIGDHQQLRPSVETYLLRRDYHFDVSMMERLVNNDLPYSTLSMQNRMREEFADLLKDIYPKLKSNLAQVRGNFPASCFGSSMFFWDHSDPETSSRSYVNDKEAERAINLALFLILQGYKPAQITILSPYLGQVRLLRKLMKEAEDKYPKYFQADVKDEKATKPENLDKSTIVSNKSPIKAAEDKDTKNTVSIHTVDLYQGDENDFVIISLVRSNESGKIGFVGDLNRRCVAQSRSRCGLYFIGNKTCLTMKPNSVWCEVLRKLEDKGCVGTRFHIKCPTHPQSKVSAESAADIPLDKSFSFCRIPCTKLKDCRLHVCGKPCQPKHQHTNCKDPVQFTFNTCGHFGTKKCSEDENSKKCEKDILVGRNCGHSQSCKCYERMKVTRQSCEQIVSVKFPNCYHYWSCKCCEQGQVASMRCEEKVVISLPKCGHSCIFKCHEREKAECNKPCERNLECGHPCQLKCAMKCDSKPCEVCLNIEKAKQQRMEAAKKAEILRETNREIANLSKTLDFISRCDLSRDGDTAARYLSLEDMVVKYIQPEHKWFPRVTRIEKVTNTALEKKWLLAKTQLQDPSHVELKFHGTNEEAVDSIVNYGFMIPVSGKQMFGKGVYFATDSSKSAQKCYTKDSKMLLVCEVLLGKCLTVERSLPGMDINKLHVLGYDSLFAKRGTQQQGGVCNDEFVVYDPNQAIVRFIVHYEETDCSLSTLATTLQPKMGNLGAPTFTKYDLLPSKRGVKTDSEEFHFRLAESQFLRLMRRLNMTNGEVTSVEYYINPELERRFKIMQVAMKAKYPKGEESEVILAFHGTKLENIDPIVKNNFDIQRLGASTGDKGYYGAGIYFSEFPSVSMGYGNIGKLLLCKVLPGKTYTCMHLMVGASCMPGYDSHGFDRDHNGRYKELVIFNSDQILPCYVINYTA